MPKVVAFSVVFFCVHIMITEDRKLLGEQVGQYGMESHAEVQQYHSPVRKQASGISTRASLGSRASQAKKAPSREVLRAVQQMEAQLRVTRQDALQLATAVVRLEKEKAVLQAQGSGISTQVWHVSLAKRHDAYGLCVQRPKLMVLNDTTHMYTYCIELQLPRRVHL